MTSFNGKICVCETCKKHLLKNIIPCLAVCNKIETDSTSNGLIYLKRFKKIETQSFV